MSDENRFFRFVWRFNALAIAVVALLGAAGLGFSLWMQYGHHMDWGPVGHFAPVPKSAEQKFTYRLQDEGYGAASATLVSGDTRERVMSLVRWNGPPKDYGLQVIRVEIGSGGRMFVGAVNMLIIDAASGASRWMFRGYDRLIVSEDPIYATEPSAAPYTGVAMPPTIGLVLSVVDKDTDGDGQLTAKDRTSLYAYRAGGAGAVRFLTADVIVSARQIGADKYLVVYENGKSATAATFSTVDFKLLSQKSLSSVPE